MATAGYEHGWIGPTPTPLQLAAFLWVGSVALVFAGIQPILLGALVDEHRLSAKALGQTATIEFFTTGLGVGLAGALFPPDRLGLRGAIAALALAVVNIAALSQSGGSILFNRGAAGFCEGVMVWLTASLIARAASPARWAGVFLVTQGVLQFVLAAVLPLTLMKSLGANGGFVAMAAAAVLAMLAMAWLPKELVALHLDESGARTRISRASIASLLSIFFVFAFFIGFFAYFGQLATQARLSPEEAGLVVALAIGVSIVGSGAAAIVARRLSYISVAVPSVVISFLALSVLATLPSSFVFLIASAVYGFFWGFFMPFQIPLVIETDPSRHTAVLVPGVQGVGAAAGPLFCSFFVTDADARGALAVSAVCLLLSFVISLGLTLQQVRSRRRRQRLQADLMGKAERG